MITKLIYKGNVKIKLKIKDKIITIDNHNAGTEWLNRTFCKLITGNGYKNGDIPQFLDLRKEQEQYNWVSCLNQLIPLSGKNYQKDNDNWVAIFIGAINHDYLEDKINTEAAYRLFLMTDSDDNGVKHDLAYMEVSGADLSKIVPGTQGIVEWYMQIQS